MTYRRFLLSRTCWDAMTWYRMVYLAQVQVARGGGT